MKRERQSGKSVRAICKLNFVVNFLSHTFRLWPKSTQSAHSNTARDGGCCCCCCALSELREQFALHSPTQALSLSLSLCHLLALSPSLLHLFAEASNGNVRFCAKFFTSAAVSNSDEIINPATHIPPSLSLHSLSLSLGHTHSYTRAGCKGAARPLKITDAL